MFDSKVSEFFKPTHLPYAVNKSLSLWNLPEAATAKCICISENITFHISGTFGPSFILRTYRPNHRRERDILSELAWIEALTNDRIIHSALHVRGRNGQIVQKIHLPEDGTTVLCVLFTYISGQHPKETEHLHDSFTELGDLAARMHAHALTWQEPPDFQRPQWDINAFFGRSALWGDWRDAPHARDDNIQPVLEDAEQIVRTRLERFGNNADRYGLIHADMRLANLIQGSHGTSVIDFDDCGYGWHLYDCAAALSFIENDPRVPQLKASWVAGYRQQRTLAREDELEIDTFIMLRRLALLAWIGSHPESTEPQRFAPTFAIDTLKLALRYKNTMTLHD